MVEYAGFWRRFAAWIIDSINIGNCFNKFGRDNKRQYHIYGKLYSRFHNTVALFRTDGIIGQTGNFRKNDIKN